MKSIFTAVVLAAAMLATGASGQMLILDLSGRYRCVELCAAGEPGQFAFITQSGTELSLVDDAGNPWRGYVERPGRIWVHRLDQGANYSVDGVTLQFDRGTVWERAPEEMAPAPPPRARRPVPGARVVVPVTPPAPRESLTRSPFDGTWDVTIVTQNGPCDPQYRFGAQIVDGNVAYEGGGPVNLQGQVSPNGAIWVSVAAGSGRADGEGRLSANSGGGAWRGQGSLGACVGVWEAVRRG
jgi:hypothetical protein